ncbi:MAG: response regulator transcription factor [Burkholderiaceae bacterium]
MHVLIADDHPMVRDALSRIVRQIEPQSRVDEADDFDSVRVHLDHELPDLLLLDLNMPGMDTLAGLRRLRQRYPTLSTVVASGQDDPVTIRNVLATGASGFISKSDPPQTLINALRLVATGGVYVSARLLGGLGGDAAPRPADASGLTPRQRDVLDLLLLGHPNKVIARNLGLTEGTVKIHIAAILRALQVRNRTEAVLRAREQGLGRTP